MGNVRVRKETGKLYMDFFIRGVRFREQTLLEESSKNRKTLEKLLQTVEAKIVLNEFCYEDYFPSSRNVQKAEKIGMSSIAKDSTQQTSAAVAETGLTTVTFKIFAEQWFLERQIEWRASHIRNVRSLLDSAIIPAFGCQQVHTVTKTDLLNFRTEQAKIPGRGSNKTISAKTLNTRMGLVKIILDEASDRFGFENPYRNIKPLKLQKTHIEPFSLAEVTKIIDSVRSDYRNYYILRFFTGMRTGEIDGLQWKFIDFERKQILVRETLIGGETEYTKTNGSQREIPMLGPVYEALVEQAKSTRKLSKYVFCNTTGGPLEHNNVTKRVWYPLLRHLNLATRRPYQTRHTAATLLLASGENPEWVARLLGHSSTEMLFNVYSRYIPNATRQDGSAFERLVQTPVVRREELSHAQ